MTRHQAVALVVLMFGGCAGAPQEQVSKDFEPGDATDPIVRRVQALASSQTDSLTITITNGTSYGWSSGLIVLSAPFQVGAKPSSAMKQFVSGSSATQGNATAFAQALGLTIGTTAFVVPALAAGASTNVSITVPSNGALTYLARVAGSVDDFVAVLNAPLTGSAPGTTTVSLAGYDLENGNGVTTLGNGTVGSTPRSSSFAVLDLSDCPDGKLTTAQRLWADDFATSVGSSLWPVGSGWDADFNGDWYTDGTTVRVYNPNWGGADPNAQIPVVTGFFKTMNVCPTGGALLQVDSKVTTLYSDATSDTTLVVYFFNRGGSLLSVATNSPLHDHSDRRFSVYDIAIPGGTRQVIVAPMARLGAAETGSVYYDWVTVDYELSNSWSKTVLVTDDFSKSSSGQFGNNQPAGWAEFGGDWYAMTAQKWATVGNPAWSGGSAGVDTGLLKTFALTGRTAADHLNAHVFAASTFTDPTSFVRLRLLFNDGTVVESDRQVRGWGAIDVRRQALPASATQVTVIINAYLGTAETSSLYVDDFSLTLTHAN